MHAAITLFPGMEHGLLCIRKVSCLPLTVRTVCSAPFVFARERSGQNRLVRGALVHHAYLRYTYSTQTLPNVAYTNGPLRSERFTQTKHLMRITYLWNVVSCNKNDVSCVTAETGSNPQLLQ